MTVKLAFELTGEGKPLVCLHAFALDHTEWSDVANLLRGSCTLVLPDLRGHGGSPSRGGSLTMREMAEDVIAIMDHLKMESAYFAGHSMGGYVMLSLAKNFPGRTSGLALVASHAYADTPGKRASRLETIEKVKRNGLQDSLSAMPENLSDEAAVQIFCREKISQMDAAGVIGALAAMAEREDSIDFLAKYEKPLGIIAGVNDFFIPIEMSREMAEQTGPDLYVEVEGSGHMPMMENSQAVAEAIQSVFNF